uniref:Peptidase A1 domain-containing protein n=1 Tax=Ananas comosus var. bracteatus TaxID=296719 RepID=A0A6V7QXL5_ANACO
MASFSSSKASLFNLLFLCSLLYQVVSVVCVRAPTTAEPKPLLFALRAQKVASLSLPRRPPNKLRFRHNVSLTVTLSAGNPPQNVSMVLDTGSELSWLLCSNGSSSSANPLAFEPRSSTSFSPIPCSSPTCRAQARDPAPRPRATRGAGSATSPRPPPPPPPPLREDDDDGDAGHGQGSPLVRDPVGDAALLLLHLRPRRRGGPPPRPLPLPLPLNYTPLSRPPPLPLPYFDRAAYSVRLLGIRVGGARLPLPASALAPDHTGAGQTMVDSGTQFTFLLGDAYAALRAEFLRRTRGVLRPLDYAFEGAFDLCFRTPEGAAAPARATRRLPAVALELEGAEVAVEGERLLYEVGNGVRCLTFGNADLAGISAFVIGHHHQQNLWVEYDLDNARLGFAPVRCDLASQRLGLLL